MSSDAESSAAALERYITAQLEALSLAVPADDVELMARFVEEDGMDRTDKVEGVRGMLEGVVEDGVLPEAGMDEALERVVDEWERIRAAQLAEAEAAAERTPTPPPDPRTILDTLTPEEHAAAQRAALLRQYGYVDGAAPAPARADGPPRGAKAEEAEEKRRAEERRRAIEAAIKMDGKKKKHRKQEIDDPLLWANLNKDKVQHKMQLERDAAKQGAAAKKERDRAALEKQRADAARAKADKQKKAAKQERRA